MEQKDAYAIDILCNEQSFSVSVQHRKAPMEKAPTELKTALEALGFKYSEQWKNGRYVKEVASLDVNEITTFVKNIIEKFRELKTSSKKL